jgi:hypothetical protein
MKAISLSLLMATNLIYSGIALSATGTVTLRDVDNGTCVLTAPEPGQTQIYSFVNEPVACKDWNKKARSIQFSELPSATNIIVAANRNCWDSNDPNDFPWFKLKTIKKITFTTILQIENLASYSAGQIIQPGLQMIELMKSNENGGNRDKISCVSITTSAVPPSSSTTTP